MSSTLAQQLSQVAKLQKQSTAVKKIRGKLSLLYDQQKAADVDLSTIYGIGCQGLDELIKLEPKFAQYRESLFSQAATTLHRDQQTPDVLQHIDETITSFLFLLTEFYLTPGAFKALEYLIRRYRVNEFHVETILLSAMPYHSTNEFVRLVQCLALDNTSGWTWLSRMQENGAAMPRQVLVKRSSHDKALLKSLCEGAKRLGHKRGYSKTYLSFYAVVMCELISSVAKVPEELVEQLLPYIVEGLSTEACPDYRAATLMIVTELCTQTPLSHSFISAVIVSMVQGMEADQKDSLRTILLVLSHMAASQPDLSDLPSSAIKVLFSVPTLCRELSGLEASRVRLQPLLRLITQTLTSWFTRQSSSIIKEAEACLIDMIRSGLLSHQARSLTSDLLQAAAAAAGEASHARVSPSSKKSGGQESGSQALNGSGSSAVTAVKRVLVALERRHPEAVDSAINALLLKPGYQPRNLRSPDAKGTQARGPKDDEDDEDEPLQKSTREQQLMYQVVLEAFAGTAHVPCGESGLTLLAAASAPQAGVRRQALMQLDALLSSESMSQETSAQLHACALSGLTDEDWSCVEAVLDMKELQALPATALLPALQTLLLRLSPLLLAPSKHQESAGILAVAKKALMAMASAATAPAYIPDQQLLRQCLLILMDITMAPIHAYGAARTAVKAAKVLLESPGCHGSIYRHLAAALSQYSEPEVQPLAPDLKPAAAKKLRKERRMGQALELRQHAVSRISTAILENPVLAPELLLLATSNHAEGNIRVESQDLDPLQRLDQHLNARHLILLSMHAALLLRALPTASSSAGAPLSESKTKTKSASVKSGVTSPPSTSLDPLIFESLKSLCLSELEALLSSAGTSAAALLDSRLFVTELIDVRTGAPSLDHLQQSISGPMHQLHGTMLSHVLLTALSAISTTAVSAGPSVENAEASDEKLLNSFSRLAALQPASIFQEHLLHLVRAALPQPQQQQHFLQQLYAAPPSSSISSHTQVAALKLQLVLLLPANAAPTPTRVHKGEAAASANPKQQQPSYTPFLLAAACSDTPAVRSAASACFSMLTDAASPQASVIQIVLSALGRQASVISADPTAAVQLLRSCFFSPSNASAPPATSVAEAATSSVKSRRKSTKASGESSSGPGSGSGAGSATVGTATSATLLALDAKGKRSLLKSLSDMLESLIGCSDADVHAATALLRSLLPPDDDDNDKAFLQDSLQVLADPCLLLSQSLVKSCSSPLGCCLSTALVSGLSAPLMRVLTATSVISSSSSRSGGQEVAAHLAELLVKLPSSTNALLLHPLRLAVLQAMARDSAILPALYSCDSAQARYCFQALVSAAATDPSEECRRAARSALEAADVEADMLVPILTAATAAMAQKQQQQPDSVEVVNPTPSKKRTKATLPSKAIMSSATTVADTNSLEFHSLEEGLSSSVMVLELLQWKTGISRPEAVLKAVQELTEQLWPLVGSISVLTEKEQEDEEEEQVDVAARKQSGSSSSSSTSYPSSLAGYAAQLALSGMEALLREHMGDSVASASAKASLLSVIRPTLAVKAAQDAPDSALRNAALSVVSLLAGLMPQAVLEHVLQVLSVINQSAAIQDDQHSQAVSAAAMKALAPAWLAAGREAAALWVQVIGALPDVQSHRRPALLTALMNSVPKESGLPVALLILIQKSAESHHTAVNTMPSRLNLEAVNKFTSTSSSDEWLLDLATHLAAQAAPSDCLSALAMLLRNSVHVSQGRAHAVLPRMAVAFTTTQLKAKHISRKVPGAGSPVSDGSEIQQACKAIMEEVMSQMQSLTLPLQQQQQQDTAPEQSTKNLQRACKAALEGLYRLLEALQAVLPSDAYLKALDALAHHDSDKLKRRALKLFSDKVRLLPGELEALADIPERERKEHEGRLAVAALLPCAMLQNNVSADVQDLSPLSKQALLFAVSAAAVTFGKLRPESVLAALPAVLACGEDGNTGVRGSSFVALAAATQAVGMRMVPLLPAAMKATLSAGQAAARRLQVSSAVVAAAAAADDDDDVAQGNLNVEEAAAVELAAVLAALGALVKVLGAFLSPYLKEMLGLLMDPSVLQCSQVDCAAAAAAVRDEATAVVPARLLLEPLFAQLPKAIQAGLPSTLALIQAVTSVVERMETKVAAAYHEQVFLFLLRVLDIRAVAPPSLKECVHEAEAAAVKAVVALVMKLTESRFKPLFLRLVEWAAAAAHTGEQLDMEAAASISVATARQITLFAVADALTDRLRSVFVPYHRYLLDKAVKHLTGSASALAQPRKKQRKQLEGAPVAADASVSFESWLLNMRVLRSIHRALMYDTSGFFDSEKLDRLLQPLVSQLEAIPPPAVAALLACQCKDSALDGYLLSSLKASQQASLGVLHEAYDALGVAVVAVLVQLGIAANTDTFWKPLNHRVLMYTRSSVVRTRLLAIEVVVQLVERLREEYLVLLPETIPFIAELLEDPDLAVEARTQHLVSLFEELSGEKLDQFLKT